MSKLILSTALGVSFTKQAALQTASVAAGIEKLTKLNASLSVVETNVETDEAEIGSGHEWATQMHKVSTSVSGSIEKYCSSEMLAWLMHFFLGSTTDDGEGTYTMVPSGVCDPLELPTFTLVEQIGQDCGSVALDRALVGCGLEDFTISLGTGPSRQSSRFSANFIGCGKVDMPSAIELDALPLTEHLLPSSSAAVTILGVNYVSAKNLVSLELTGRNNIRRDSGYYPGSGTQNGFALMGRMERGTRQLGLRVVARFDAGSTELTKLMALTTGTATIGLTNSATESFLGTFHKAAFKTAQIGEADGIVTVSVDIAPLYDATDGLFTAVCKTAAALA